MMVVCKKGKRFATCTIKEFSLTDSLDFSLAALCFKPLALPVFLLV